MDDLIPMSPFGDGELVHDLGEAVNSWKDHHPKMMDMFDKGAEAAKELVSHASGMEGLPFGSVLFGR